MLEENGQIITNQNGQENKEAIDTNTELKDTPNKEEISVRPAHLWAKGISGNPKGRPKNTPFSLKDDLIKSLKRIKHKNPHKYQEIIDSYWNERGMRQFLLEIVDGKARQSTEIIGSLENPVRIIEVKQMEIPQNEAKT